MKFEALIHSSSTCERCGMMTRDGWARLSLSLSLSTPGSHSGSHAHGWQRPRVGQVAENSLDPFHNLAFLGNASPKPHSKRPVLKLCWLPG